MFEELREKLKKIKIYGYSLAEFLGIIADILVIPIFTVQMVNIYMRGKSSDYSLYFILLQLLGTPEGGGAAITGIVKDNTPLTIIGTYGFIYYLLVLYYYIFPRTKISNIKNSKN